MHTIEVSVTYKNKKTFFNAHFLQAWYTYKFEIDVNGINIFFEPDEEQNYRALVAPEMINKINNIDGELLKLIAKSLKNILK